MHESGVESTRFETNHAESMTTTRTGVEDKYKVRTGTTPPCRALRWRWSFPPSPEYTTTSIRDECSVNATTEIKMTRLKIEHGKSRTERVKLQVSIDQSIADDIDCMAKWSNNEKNYIINELLRFAVAQAEEFQAYKQSIGKSPATKPEITAGGVAR